MVCLVFETWTCISDNTLPSRQAIIPPSIFDLCIIISKHRDEGYVFAKVLFCTLLVVLMRRDGARKKL